MTDYADRCHGNVGNRGRRLGETRSRLLLTGLPRGSVGLELSKAPSEDLFAEDEVADTLSHVTRLIESSGRRDEEFAATLNETAPRVVQNLRTFPEVFAKRKAGLRIESGDLRCSMTPDEVASAFARVAATFTSDETIQIDGTLRGVLLESWEFDFLDNNGRVIDGKIEDSLTQEMVAELNKSFFNEKCRASVTKTTVTFRNGGIRTSYRLVNITAIVD